MTDLVRDYFERDLTDQESMELGRLLETSPRDNARFLELSGKAYRKLGLPEPLLPGREVKVSFFRHAWWKPVLALAACGLALAVGWQVWVSRQGGGPIPAAGSEQLEGAPPQVPNGAIFTTDLKPEKYCVVAVRVVDKNGKVVRNLYSGMLDKGKYGVGWDGRDDHGRLVEKGQYRVEAQYSLPPRTDQWGVNIQWNEKPDRMQ